MRRRPEPFYRTSKKCWYVQFGKQQIRLAKTKKEAYEEYDKLVADRRTLTPAVPVVYLLVQFLQWVQKRRSQKTYDSYQMQLQSFAKHFGKRLGVSSLQPKHITAWIDHWHARSSDSTRHGAIRAVQRVFSWAVKEGRLSRNPIANAEKPSPTKREVVVTEEQFQRMLTMATDRAVPGKDRYGIVGIEPSSGVPPEASSRSAYARTACQTMSRRAFSASINRWRTERSFRRSA